VKRFLRLTFIAGVFLIADSQYLSAKPIPNPKPSLNVVPAVERQAAHEKQKTPAHVYAIAGSVVAVSTFGSLAAIYFARKRNTG